MLERGDGVVRVHPTRISDDKHRTIQSAACARISQSHPQRNGKPLTEWDLSIQNPDVTIVYERLWAFKLHMQRCSQLNKY